MRIESGAMARISIVSGDILGNMKWEGHLGVCDGTYRTWWPGVSASQVVFMLELPLDGGVFCIEN